MALTKCKECQTDISDQASACPKCGAPVSDSLPRKTTSLFTWLVVGFLGILLITSLMPSTSAPGAAVSADPAKAKPPPTAEEKQLEADRMQAGSLVLTIKNHAKDPDSFKLVSAGATNNGTSCIEYSATNSFNARIRGFAVLRRGKTSISEAAADWNKYCAHKDFTNFTDLFQKTILVPD